MKSELNGVSGKTCRSRKKEERKMRPTSGSKRLQYSNSKLKDKRVVCGWSAMAVQEGEPIEQSGLQTLRVL